MKKNSKSQVRDYSSGRNSDPAKIEYYGLIKKDGRISIDTKRYKKFFKLPSDEIEHRTTVYFKPNKIKRHDYNCNIFRDTLLQLKQLWNNEFKKAIDVIRTPKDVENDTRVANLSTGVYEYDEANTMALFAGIKRSGQYEFVIKSIYAQFYQQMMSQIDALILRVITANGYCNRDYSRKLFDTFIQGKQVGNNKKSFFNYDNYIYYDKAYLVWNFLKHNSVKSYDILKKTYPDMIDDNSNNYKNGDLALTCLNIDEDFIIYCLDNLSKFFDEVCSLGFGENVESADWNYDNYFVDKANDEIEMYLNPLGLSPFI